MLCFMFDPLNSALKLCQVPEYYDHHYSFRQDAGHRLHPTTFGKGN